MRLVKEVMDNNRTGYLIGGTVIWNIRYADDTTLLARNREDLSHMAETLREESLEFRVEINNNKTNVMIMHGQGQISIQGETIAEVDKFKFPSSYMTMKETTSMVANIWKSTEISRETKAPLAKSPIWSLALYGCKRWTLQKEDEKRLTALEMWLWRRALRISWTKGTQNTWVREQVRIAEEKRNTRRSKEK